jgi:hypothetical protein
MIEAVLLVLAVAVGIAIAMRMDVEPAPSRRAGAAQVTAAETSSTRAPGG